MPELPEIETIKTGLLEMIGSSIDKIIIRHPRLRYPLNQQELDNAVGNKIISLTRRAKYLLIDLSNGATLVFHLGMSGRLTLYRVHPPEILKHDHVDIICDNLTLRYNDPRRFGCLVYSSNYLELDFIASLGPEPLGSEFSSKYLQQKLSSRNTPIKQVIMDNSIVVGIGNIYACEALFTSKISPLRPGKSLTSSDCRLLVKNIKQVLTQAIAAGGSSISDYQNAHGELGYFQNLHQVYGRAGKKCHYCNSVILETRLAQRNSFYCPQCQV